MFREFQAFSLELIHCKLFGFHCLAHCCISSLEQAARSSINRKSLQYSEMTAPGWKKAQGTAKEKLSVVCFQYCTTQFALSDVSPAVPPHFMGQGKGNTQHSQEKELTQGFDADFFLPVYEPVTQELQSVLVLFLFFSSKWQLQTL